MRPSARHSVLVGDVFPYTANSGWDRQSH